MTSVQILGDWSCTVKKRSQKCKKKKKKKKKNTSRSKIGLIKLLSTLPSLLGPMAGFPKEFSTLILFVDGF